MELNFEQIEELRGLSGLLLSIKEIALIMGLNYSMLKDEVESECGPVYLAYIGGLLKTKAELNSSIIKLAKQGSSPAQTLAKKILEEMDFKNLGE